MFISSNLEGEEDVHASKEYSKLNKIFKNSPYSEYIDILPELEAERYQLGIILTENNPQILHFSAHGREGCGVFLRGDEKITSDELDTEIIETLKSSNCQIKIIFLNTCNSEALGQKMAEYIDFVICTTKDVHPIQSIKFSSIFYKKFILNVSINDSFQNALMEYNHLYKKESDEYKLIKKEKHDNVFIEDLLAYHFWFLFKIQFDAKLNDVIEWALPMLLNLDEDKKKEFCRIFAEFINNFIENSNNVPGNFEFVKKWKSDKLLLEYWRHLNDPERTHSIEMEKILTQLRTFIKKLKNRCKINKERLKLELSGFISSYVKDKKQLSIYLENLPLNSDILLFKLNLMIKNLNHILNVIKVDNEDEIINYSDEILLKYCKQQLELTNLSSKYDYRYDKTLFVKDDELCSKFNEFIENMGNKNDRQRIFLLLGHMGLGKTWNASFIAYRCIEKGLPTFFFHLGDFYQTKFDNLLGGFKNSKLEALYKRKNIERKLLIVFDGFDELYIEERNDFFRNLHELLKAHSENLMVLLTSRLVDWINTEELAKRTYYKEYIFQNDEFKFFDEQHIRTGASYILSDIENEEKFTQLLAKYELPVQKMKDFRIKELLKKPFIVNLIYRTNKKLIENRLDPFNDDWFNLFTGSNISNTILNRMGISEATEDVFQDFCAEVADPYSPIPEYDIKGFISSHKKHWDVIMSSGIIKKNRSKLQYEYLFNEIYQKFIERYNSELKARFHGRYLSKADVILLNKLEQKYKLKLKDISDLEPNRRHKGYVVGEEDRIIELHLSKFSLNHIPFDIFKLIGLQKLNLFRNEFTKVPKDIKRLVNLRELNLSSNELINLPIELSSLSNLQILNLMNNELRKIEEWWHYFKNLEIVNISRNRYGPRDAKGDVSIDYVADGLDYIDNQVLNSKGETSKLFIKDAIVREYLIQINSKNRNNGSDLEFKESDKMHMTKLVLTNFPELKPLFWSLEHLEYLKFKGNCIPFKENDKIKELEFGESQKQDSLVIYDSIMKLENFEKITIEGYKDISIENGILNCLKLSHFYLFSDKCKKFPEIILHINNIQNWIINSTISTRDFNQLKIEYEKQPIGIIKLLSEIGIRRLTIPKNVSNLFFTSINSPANVDIQSKIHRLIFIFDNTTNYRLFDSIKINERIRTGNFFFLSKVKNTSFSLNGNFKKCQYIRLEDQGLKEIPIWVFTSEIITKFYITSFGITRNVLDCFKMENKGRAEIRVHPSCNLDLISENLNRITQIRFEYLKIRKLPSFIFTLTQIKYLFITSKQFSQIDSEFGSEKNEYKLEIAIRTQLDLNDNFEKLEQISHVLLDNVNVNNYDFLALIKNLKFIRIIRGEFKEIPDVLENMQNIKCLHLRYDGKTSFRRDYWKEEGEPRFEFELDNQICNLQHLIHITHLRISGFDQISINSQINKNNTIKHLRIDGKLRKLQFIKYLSQIKCIELNITNYILTQIPDLIAQFSFIERIIITTEEIPFKESFWNECSYAYLMMRISIKFGFNILDQFENISHLWIEFLNDQNIPVSLNEMIKTKRLKVLNKNKIELDLDSYLKIENPGYFILIK